MARIISTDSEMSIAFRGRRRHSNLFACTQAEAAEYFQNKKRRSQSHIVFLQQRVPYKRRGCAHPGTCSKYLYLLEQHEMHCSVDLPKRVRAQAWIHYVSCAVELQQCLFCIYCMYFRTKQNKRTKQNRSPSSRQSPYTGQESDKAKHQTDRKFYSTV